MSYQPSPREFFPSFPWAALALGALDGDDWRMQASLVLAHPMSKHLSSQYRNRLWTLAYEADPLRCPSDLRELRETAELFVDMEARIQ